MPLLLVCQPTGMSPNKSFHHLWHVLHLGILPGLSSRLNARIPFPFPLEIALYLLYRLSTFLCWHHIPSGSFANRKNGWVNNGQLCMGGFSAAFISTASMTSVHSVGMFLLPFFLGVKLFARKRFIIEATWSFRWSKVSFWNQCTNRFWQGHGLLHSMSTPAPPDQHLLTMELDVGLKTNCQPHDDHQEKHSFHSIQGCPLFAFLYLSSALTALQCLSQCHLILRWNKLARSRSLFWPQTMDAVLHPMHATKRKTSWKLISENPCKLRNNACR